MTASTADRASARLIDRSELRRLARPLPPMGTQPALDGIRAVSVALVILYHAGFARMHGGFFGVEVFFVVSGYLITSLLWEERSRNGRVSLGKFWHRRARRLLPALFVVLLASSLWALWFADEHLEPLRRDLLPALLYVGNWGQVFGSTPYFSPADPVLRHMWSLAVEEQWYLIWPLLFIGLIRVFRANARRMAIALGTVAAAIAVWSAIASSSSHATISVFGHHPDRFNFLYLNTITRSSGLLLGAALALLWRPWARRARATAAAADARRRDGMIADVVGFAAMAGIVAIALTRGPAILADASLYQRWLPMVTVLSAVAVGASVHPDTRLLRVVFGNAAITAIGQRSYGLYLWHWPVFVFAGVRADHSRFLPAMLLTAGLSELCYRLVETPIRRSAIGRWWARAGEQSHRRVLAGATACFALAIVGVIGAQMVMFDPVDPSVDDSEVAFDPNAVEGATPMTDPAAPMTSSDGSTVTSIAGGATPVTDAMTGLPVATTVPASTTTLPALPRPVVIVGDSTAHALAINLPSGIESTFTVTDGSLDGCGIWDTGAVVSKLTTFRRSFDDCAGWQDEWASAVARNAAPLALVVIGAWDVFDVRVGDVLVPFGSRESDDLFHMHMQTGIDALVAAGAHVALLEVPCMRPVSVKGAGVPALPERGEDDRVAHVNQLLRSIVAKNPSTVTFVPGPTQWCNDPAIATDLGYRWDGVHAYKPGAKLVFETIASTLLAIPL